MDICTHVGFTILQYAKLWMLMFHFDFLDRSAIQYGFLVFFVAMWTLFDRVA